MTPVAQGTPRHLLRPGRLLPACSLWEETRNLRAGEIARTLGVTNDELCCLLMGLTNGPGSLDQDHECPDIVEVALQFSSHCATWRYSHYATTFQFHSLCCKF